MVCEFLDYATSPTAAATEAAAPVDPWLIVGAVRLLGRFLADAPDAHEAAVRTLLPRLLTSSPTSTDGSAAATADTATDIAAGVAVTGADTASSEGQQNGDAAGGGGVLLPVPVISFLLPAMLTWTSKHSSNHQEWVSFMLGADSGCLNALATYAQDVAAAAAAAGAVALDAKGSIGFGGSDSLRAAEVQLGSVCQVLYQLLSGRSVLLSARAQQAKQQQAVLPALTPAQKAALAAVLQGLCSWSVGRLCGMQQSAQLVQGSAAASAAQSVLGKLSNSGLQLPTLLPAAALSGQLLGLVAFPAGPATAAAEAAELLCWGCEVGWYVQLSVACQQQEGASGVPCMLGMMQQTLQVWEVAELDEVWEACLQRAAELLTQHGSGSVFGKVFGSSLRGGWLKDAMQGWQEIGTEQAPGGDVGIAAGAAAAAAVEASMALPLLLQAASAVLN